ncbi:MAG: 4-(cytidine 5'-diphospho)-2-C-methyl-D-erythritol kinase [Rhodospirillales bacterium]
MVAEGNWQIAQAPAKVNLSLRIVGRRADGFHLLDSIVVFANVGDHVAIRPAVRKPTFSIRGPFASSLEGPSGNNLAILADQAFTKAFGGKRSDIRLWKRLPTAAGIGGGSADAAAVLRLKAKLVGMELNDPNLSSVALSLGADVPMCLRGLSAKVEGIGELLSLAPSMPPLAAVLVNPGVRLATPTVFKARSGPFSSPAVLPKVWQNLSEVAEAIDELGNDLTQSAIAIAPEVEDVLESLRALSGVRAVSMSGSGSTCFALFDDSKTARREAGALKSRQPGWWISSTILNL